MMSKNLKHDSLSKKVLLSVLAAGVMSTFVVGSALAEQKIDPTDVQKTFSNISGQKTENNLNISNNDVLFKKPSDYGYLLGPYLNIYLTNPNSSLILNNATFENNKTSAEGSPLQGIWGGAVFSKGVVNFVDNSFKNNVIVVDNERTLAAGGAVLADAAINTGVDNGGQPNFVITKDITYSGNNVITSHEDIWYDTWGAVAQSSGGFLFLDRNAVAAFDVAQGATLTIGENGASGNKDSIASSIPYEKNKNLAIINKNGDGTLQINSNFNKYYGLVKVNAGTLNLDQNWTARNAVTVAENAKLNVKDITLVKLLDGLDFTKTYGTEKYPEDENKGLYRPENAEDYTSKLVHGGAIDNSTITGSITTAKGSTLTAKNIVVNAGSVKADGTVNASVVYAVNGNITLNGGGTITGSYGLEGEMDDAAVAAVAKNGSEITANNVDFIGEVRSGIDSKELITGGVVTLTGGSVTATELTGDEKGYTELSATNGKLTATNVKINSNVSAHTEGTVEINNSNITAQEGICAEGTNAVVNLNGSADNVYTVGECLLATDKGKIYINGGTLKEDALRSKMYNVKDKNPDREGKTLNTDANGIVLAENGVISTMSDQIYANAASATQKEAGEVTNEGIDFQGGTLSLNDAEYTLAYAKDAGTKVGSTKIVMTGKLAGAVDDTIKVADAATVGSDVALDKVTAETDGSLLVGSEAVRTGTDVEGIEVKDQVKNGFAVASLNLGQGAKGVVITNDKVVTLGGSQGGNIITVDGAKQAVKIVVGTINNVDGASSNAGTLNIGNSLATANTNYELNGEVVVNDASNLNVKGQTEITEALTLNGGNVDATQGKLTTAKLAVEKDSALIGEVKATSLKGAAGKTLAIGDKDNAGKLTVEAATLNGATLFLDPAWKNGATIGDASGFAVTDVSSALDGAYVAGQNSKLAFGADLAAAEAKFAKTGYEWGGDDESISAAAYIAKSVDLGTTGSITVNGSLTTAPTATAGKVTFADNSMLIVDAEQTAQEAAIKGVNSADITFSTLYIDGAKKGETYHILAGVNNGWADQLIDSNNSLLEFTNAELAGEFAVTASTASVKDVFEGQVIAPNAYDATLNVKSDGDAAYDFIMAAADSKVNGGYDGQVSALNSAAAMSELAGVEHGTYAASNLLTDAVSDHMSLANAKDHDSDIWAKYIHTKEDVDGLSIANFGADYDAQYNGIVVGADLYKNGKATIGAALTYVDGNINGNTLAARTKNDATYYGASIYGGIQNEDSAVIGDISYLHGKNDITQYNSGKTLTADAKSDAFSIGVRAEKSVKAGVGKFVPYAGLRYMHLGTGNYTNSIGMSYDGDDMNLWLLPVGVKYSADVKTGSWTIRPIAEVGYVWNMGDRDATQTVSLNGASDGFGYDVTDSGSYIGRFMIEAEKANVTYGLGYEYQKGDSVKANRWMANLNWSF